MCFFTFNFYIPLQPVDRRRRELTDEDVKKISETYHAWRGEKGLKYEDAPGFCKSAKSDTVEKHDFILTPGRYVGTPEEEEDSEEFEEKMKRLTSELSRQMNEGARMDMHIKNNLARIDFQYRMKKC
ncbi:Putative type I restriction enzyme HindVIIP M protein (fragment) [groundwater metagenome]|uniref:Putative type I restriction enzyme HindVIIP M protein n=1 Tax=groundwater metagenome TaxID=717931 RepID=A0A098E7C5_9ZZZZ